MKHNEKMFFKFFLSPLSTFSSALFVLIALFHISSLSAQTINLHKGDVTGLPLPRFVSVKSNKVNVRRGPNSTYQIDWVYTRSGVPLKVIAEYENWRKIEDFQGEGGWVHSRLLSGTRFVIFKKNRTLLKRKPNERSPALAVIKQGVIAKLLVKNQNWSEISVQGYSGWIPNLSVWGTSVNDIGEKRNR